MTLPLSPLAFRCTACGNCCRDLRVAVTTHDLERLAQATLREPHQLVAWLAPDAVDMSGEPDSFVELSEGRRLMVLAQLEGACRLLGADNRCQAYAARPLDCRAFPFDFQSAPRDSSPSARRLALLPLSHCDYAEDGQQDAGELERVDAERWRELATYRARVARWNRLARHRRRLGHRVGSGEDFLRFAL